MPLLRSLLGRSLFGSGRVMFASLLFAAACSGSNAYADQPVARPGARPSQIALDIAPARQRAPYDVQVLREDGEVLPTFSQRDRFYVQGNAGERYVIRVSNPTAHRIEAVISVDGLDVIDGENGDLRKRGYVVPPYGETRIEGFRTSSQDVATFRFSSVGGSYAGQKGKARNVGVIAVALFEEQAIPEQEIIVNSAGPVEDYDGVPARAPRSAKLDHAEGKKRTADAAEPRAMPAPATAAGGAAKPVARKAPPRDRYDDDADEAAMPPPPPPGGAVAQRERLGLGTEFGEQRDSAASFTRFVRAPGRPIAIAELRYNDTAGLLALGIPVQPLPDAGEIMTRETADPFPGDRFAQPPR